MDRARSDRRLGVTRVTGRCTLHDHSINATNPGDAKVLSLGQSKPTVRYNPWFVWSSVKNNNHS